MLADIEGCDSDVGFELIAADQICESSDSCSSVNSVTLSDAQASSSNLYSEVLSCSHHASIELLPEQIRWMYRDSAKHRKWIPFIGYDSLRLECKYRETRVSIAVTTTTSSRVVADERVVVKGGLYEVDVIQMKCFPIYWSSKGDICNVIRGRWFIDDVWQPIEDQYADVIENEHCSLLRQLSANTCQSQPLEHEVEINDCHAEWRSPDNVYFYRQKSPSKIYRAFHRTFRIGQGTGGVRVRRGYCREALMVDKPVAITHLVFVIHGIGQRMYAGSILKCCADLQESCQKMMKTIPDVDLDVKRIEFIPVEWRSSLTLDGDTVDTITPNKVRDVRTFLNGSAMDVMYYTSPLYRTECTGCYLIRYRHFLLIPNQFGNVNSCSLSRYYTSPMYRTEIVTCLRNELNRLYSLFTHKNPYFEANGGKVSIVAHSLGAVIVYDIITGWNPGLQSHHCGWDPEYQSRDKESSTSERMCKRDGDADQAKELRHELETARQRVRQLELQLDALDSDNNLLHEMLTFKLDCFFTVGSPLAVFLALRGIRPNNITTSQDHILPTSLCRRLFNIFHPSDPIAYRLEPLILRHYSGIKPLRIHRYDVVKKESYDEMKPVQYTAESLGAQQMTGSSGNAVLSNGCDETERESNIDSDSSERLVSNDKDCASSLDEDHPSPAESSGKSADNGDNSFPDAVLESRLDFMLKERAMESAYLATLTSHTAYWTNLDVAVFILTHIFSSISPCVSDT